MSDAQLQDIHADRILILDFGSQYTQLIARRVREARVYCEIRAFDMDAQAIAEFAPKGIILSGGPESVFEASHVRAPEAVFELGVPLLGICYGMHTMPAMGALSVEAMSLKPSGNAVTLSPWLIHTSSSPKPSSLVWSSMSLKSIECPRARTRA